MSIMNLPAKNEEMLPQLVSNEVIVHIHDYMYMYMYTVHLKCSVKYKAYSNSDPDRISFTRALTPTAPILLPL